MVELSDPPATRTSLQLPFAATAYCSGPSSDRLDPERLVTTEANRWSRAGEPTIYVAGDPGVALAEIGRHWTPTTERQKLWRLEIRLAAAIDLRRPEVRSAVGIPDDPRWYLDPERCRDLAQRFRRLGCDGLVVPSVAFLDDRARWNAVLFLDPPTTLATRVGEARALARLEFGP